MILHYFVYLLFFGAIAAETFNSSTEILELWDKLDKEFQVDTQKDVVLLIGPSRSGKSTLTLLLTGARLESKETSEDSGQFVFHDYNKKIGDTTSDSHTIIPEPVIDPELNAAYYDCPGFEDSRPSYEVPVAYLIHKLLTKAKSFKIVLVVKRSSLIKGEERKSFPDLVEYLVMLLKDIERYKDTIAIVATKVDNIPDEDNEEALLDDATLIQDVENYLLEEKRDAEKQSLTPGLSLDDARFYHEKIKLLDILSKRNNDSSYGYERIGIFRRAMEEGDVKDMLEIQKNKNDIKRIIMDNLKYVVNDKNASFGYVVSSNAENEMNELINEILGNELNKNVFDVCEQMKNHYGTILGNVTDYNRLKNLQEEIKTDLDSISTSEPLVFVTDLIRVAKETNVNIQTEKVQKNIDFLKFLLNVKYKQLSMPTKLKSLKDSVEKFTLSEYKTRVEFMITQLLTIQLPTAVTPLFNETERFFSEMEGNTYDLKKLKDKISEGYQSLAKVSISDPQTLVNAVKQLSIVLTEDTSTKMNAIVRNFEWYKSLENSHLELFGESKTIMEKTKQKLNNAKLWYTSLIDVYSDLCSFHCEKPEEEHAIIEELLNKTKSADKVHDIGFEMLKACTKKEYNVLRDLGDITLDSYKLNALKTVLSNALISPNITCSEDKLNMTVTGNIIRMSSVVTDQNCWQTSKYVEIFAQDSVVVDSDVKKFGSENELVIMSPVWSIIGKKEISLTGDDGKSKDKAKDGEVKNRSPGHGEHGEVGNPGGPGGSFFGIGNVFVNGAGLTIQSKGGNGGPGQNAGKGADGVNGSIPYTDSDNAINLDDCLVRSYTILPTALVTLLLYKELKRRGEWNCMSIYLQMERFPAVDWSFWIRDDKKLTKAGSPGIDGGDGGNGGEGGVGGKPGHIEIFELGPKSNIIEDPIVGNAGAVGIKGLGGLSAQRSYIMEINIVDSWWVGIPGVKLTYDTKVYSDTYEPKTRSGNNGADGTSNKNYSDPLPAAYSCDPTITMDNYKDFLRKNAKNSFKESEVEEFITRMKTHKVITEFLDKN